MKLSPNLSLFQILSPRDWWILPDLNWRQNWFQLISLNRAHQKVCTGDIFEYPNVGNSVWFSIWYLITRSWLWFFVSKAHKILSFVAHSTASSRWFLDAHNFIPTLDHFNLYCLGLIPAVQPKSGPKYAFALCRWTRICTTLFYRNLISDSRYHWNTKMALQIAQECDFLLKAA